MTEQHIKEQVSLAYARAIAACAGIAMREYNPDYGLDGRFNDIEHDIEDGRFGETGFGIDFQLKATTNIVAKRGRLLYDLEAKNYKDLIKTRVGTPRILIVYSMPKRSDEWVMVSNEETILKRCAWWCSLKGNPETNNTRKKRIEIPASQRLTPNELRRLIERVKEGAEL